MEKPTYKQIQYAKRLGVENPESYTKEELSTAIDEAKRKKNKSTILTINGVKHTNWCKIWKTGKCNCK